MGRAGSWEGTREINMPVSSACPPGGWRAKGAHQRKSLWLSLLGQRAGGRGWRVDLEGQMKTIQHAWETAKELEWPLCTFTSTGENSKVICFPTLLFIFPSHMFIRNILSLNIMVLYPGRGTGSFVPRPGLQNQVSHRKGPSNMNFKQTSQMTHTQLSGAPSYRMKGER